MRITLGYERELFRIILICKFICFKINLKILTIWYAHGHV